MLSMEPRVDALAQIRRGIAEYCLLALLAREERYGFDLARTLGDAGLVAGEGTVYPLLSRLAAAGRVRTTWRESTAGPPRKYYALTPAGVRALGQFRAEWAQFRDAVDALLHEGGDQ